MLTVLALAAAALVPPPLVVHVQAARGIPHELVMMTLAEAGAIYRKSGFQLQWEFDEARSGVRVVIDDDAPKNVREGDVALGWIIFESDVPSPDVHLSFSNAVALMEEAQGASAASHMTELERNLMLSRALGRALAHELGHYLLASKAHAKAGLMRPRRTASDFFGPFRDGFDINPAQRSLMATRLMGADLVVSSSR